MARLLESGLDIYAYVTFTTLNGKSIRDDMKRFVDKLQTMDVNLPLRTIPLEIIKFAPVQERIGNAYDDAIKHQWTAADAWRQELENRFTAAMRAQNIADIKLAKSRR
jgi:hypothetical protein